MSKLREEFEDCAIVDAVGMIDTEKCIKIANEHAIKFAKWILNNNIYLESNKEIHNENSKICKTADELLEIYNANN